MQPWMFFVWVFIASTQIIIFLNFLFTLKNNKKEESFDIVPVIVYNGMVYWKNNSQLCRTKNSKDLDMSIYEVVDPFNSGMNPKDIIEILEALENE